MTKKDYELIAEAIEQCAWFYGSGAPWPDDLRTPEVVLRGVAMELVERLAADNPRFDGQRFLAACGVEA
tara:strand:+ start:428 stop:634 length:207 start_codon:yes stop_codon:yes gene_type:complete